MQYTKDNREINDKTPVAMPLGYERPEPLSHLIARLVRVESIKAQSMGKESFEESDDFEVDEDNDAIASTYQMTQMQEEHVRERPQKQPAKSGAPSEKKEENLPLEKDQKNVEKPQEAQ